VCIGTPMRIVSAECGVAVCEGRGRPERISLALVGDPEVGTWILAFQGAAVRTMTDAEAASTSAALEALEAVLAGESDFDGYFADLAGREPTLPRHLTGRKA
jgi:hydrogenase expression/formation protein HypC